MLGNAMFVIVPYQHNHQPPARNHGKGKAQMQPAWRQAAAAPAAGQPFSRSTSSRRLVMPSLA